MEAGAGKSLIRAALAGLGLIGALVSSASAEDVYFNPGAAAAGAFEITAPDALAPDSIARVSARVGTRQAATEIGYKGADTLTVSVAQRRRGALVLGVAFRPRELSFEHDEMAQLSVIGYRPQDNQTYDAEGGARIRVTQYAKAIACLAPCRSYDAAREPLGHALEFVPVVWENDTAADLTKFVLLADGAPLDGQRISVHFPNGDVLEEITDNAGEVWLPSHFPRPLRLSATRLRAPIGEEPNYTADVATLTLAVDP